MCLSPSAVSKMIYPAAVRKLLLGTMPETRSSKGNADNNFNYQMKASNKGNACKLSVSLNFYAFMIFSKMAACSAMLHNLTWVTDFTRESNPARLWCTR